MLEEQGACTIERCLSPGLPIPDKQTIRRCSRARDAAFADPPRATFADRRMFVLRRWSVGQRYAPRI